MGLDFKFLHVIMNSIESDLLDETSNQTKKGEMKASLWKPKDLFNMQIRANMNQTRTSSTL
eukprot:11030928-Ditylum_brightwellii.AAC.1